MSPERCGVRGCTNVAAKVAHVLIGGERVRVTMCRTHAAEYRLEEADTADWLYAVARP